MNRSCPRFCNRCENKCVLDPKKHSGLSHVCDKCLSPFVEGPGKTICVFMAHEDIARIMKFSDENKILFAKALSLCLNVFGDRK